MRKKKRKIDPFIFRCVADMFWQNDAVSNKERAYLVGNACDIEEEQTTESWILLKMLESVHSINEINKIYSNPNATGKVQCLARRKATHILLCKINEATSFSMLWKIRDMDFLVGQIRIYWLIKIKKKIKTFNQCIELLMICPHHNIRFDIMWAASLMIRTFEQARTLFDYSKRLDEAIANVVFLQLLKFAKTVDQYRQVMKDSRGSLVHDFSVEDRILRKIVDKFSRKLIKCNT